MTGTRAQYDAAFAAERERAYPVIDDFEGLSGYALDRERYETAARVLACPVKKNPPNWQHGRVLYAAARRYLAGVSGPVTMLDIGTAKGYSALCLLWALMDSGAEGTVHSVDVIDPNVKAARNTVAEVDGLKTLADTLEPWPESALIWFYCSTGLQWLATHPGRVHIAFVDGKHKGEIVKSEGELLAMRQESGDLTIFDDVHLTDIAEAVRKLDVLYDVQRIDLKTGRAYAVGVRR